MFICNFETAGPISTEYLQFDKLQFSLNWSSGKKIYIKNDGKTKEKR
jgi:hypothetical protein